MLRGRTFMSDGRSLNRSICVSYLLVLHIVLLSYFGRTLHCTNCSLRYALHFEGYHSFLSSTYKRVFVDIVGSQYIYREALPDVVFGIVSEQKWALKVGDAMVMLCVTFLVVLVVVHQERLILLRRTFFIVGQLFQYLAQCLYRTFFQNISCSISHSMLREH